MSPEPAFPLSVRLPERPRAVHLLDADSDGLARELAGRREARAFAAGRTAGERMARADLGRTLDAAVERVETERGRAEAELAGAAVELAVEIAGAIVRAEIERDRHDVERIVRETLAAANVGRQACTVHLHPDDLRRLEGLTFRAGTRIEADPEVARGDVHVTTPHGLLVRDVDDMLEAVRARLREHLA